MTGAGNGSALPWQLMQARATAAAVAQVAVGGGDAGKRWGPDNPHPLSTMKTELVWEGKYDEWGNRRTVDAAALAMPMQKIETIDQPRSEAAAAGQLEMFEKKSKRLDDFRNRLIWGDNKLVMASLLREFKGKIDLIYIDPPFDVGADFSMRVAIGENETIEKDQSALEMVAYRDTWGRGIDSYIQMLYERFVLARDLLSETGSLYVHLGPNVSHRVRVVAEEIFPGSVSGTIVWQRTSAHGDSHWWGVVNDDILFFTKTNQYIWNAVYRPFSETYIESHYSNVEEKTERRFAASSLTAPGLRKGETGQLWRGFDPNTIGRHWGKLPSALDALDKLGRIYWPAKEGGWPREKLYLEERKGKVVQNVWDDLPPVNSQALEDTGYDTQKPSALLERVIAASSNEGDLVLDFFCGSGTTGAVAEKLGRRWIMADLGRFAIHTTRKRMIDIQRTLHADGKPYRSFDVHNLGRYERQWWQKDALKGADLEHRKLVLEFFRSEMLDPARLPSPLIHGRKGTALVHVDGIDSIFTAAEAKAVAAAVTALGAKEIYCLAWDFEMDIRQRMSAIQAEIGVKMYPVKIPREIMERNRKSPPPWLEVALLEAEPVYRGTALPGGVLKKGASGGSPMPLVDIKLTRFLPSLAEVPTKELESIKERAIRSGFDFIDFWAVDFDWKPDQPFNHHWQDYRTRKDWTAPRMTGAAKGG